MCSTGFLTDDEVSEKFKREHCEQFQVLVRMHLSFLLHMTMEENESFYDNRTKQLINKKWHLIPFGKKPKHSTSTIEGAPLTQEGICQVYQLIEFLKKEDNLKTEGTFRKTGSLERQTELKNLLIQGVTLELEQGTYSVHDCASVLKGFLAGLPEPLLTDVHFPVYCQISETCDNSTKLLESLQLLLLLLPNDNRTLLKDILELLNAVAKFEDFNKMSPENLAKLFVPHLLCPRKLSPETLLKDSQSFFSIVSFMIKNNQLLFKIPSKLVLEFRAYYEKKKILTSPNNESINDAVNTVFTFVDKERTAKENSENPTETALAQLYAHIQSLPESSKKRKLVKQFNKENGNGTPLQVIRSGTSKHKQGFRDSLKKRVFSNKLVKKSAKKYRLGREIGKSLSEETLNSPCSTQNQHDTENHRGRLFCYKYNSNSDDDNSESENEENGENCSKKLKTDSCERGFSSRHGHNVNTLTYRTGNHGNVNGLTYLTSSTPTCLPSSLRPCAAKAAFTPVDEQEPKSMSPITRSTQRMPKAMQETMMTPRSRKPVLLVSGTNINDLPKIDQRNLLSMEDLTEECASNSTTISDDDSISTGCPNIHKILFKKSKSDGDISGIHNIQSDSKNDLTNTPTSLKTTFLEYLHSRDIQPFFTPPVDSSFSSRTDDFKSADEILNLSENQLSNSLLECLNRDSSDLHTSAVTGEKELVLKPKQFNEEGKPIVFETSF